MKKNKNKIARILAVSFFESEKDDTVRKRHLSALEKISFLIDQSSDFASFLGNPVFSKEEKELFFSLTNSPKNILLFLKLIVENGMISQFKNIVHHYESLVYASTGTVKARVVVSGAHDASEAVKELMEKKLKSLLNKKITLDFEIDPSLMGGFQLEAGGFYLDTSLKKTLADLQNSL